MVVTIYKSQFTVNFGLCMAVVVDLMTSSLLLYQLHMSRKRSLMTR